MNDFGFDLDYGYGGSRGAGLAGIGVWGIIALVLSLVGCFLVYFLFVTKKDKPEQKFLAWLKEFLDFKKMLIETILKICYIFIAMFITLVSFGFIGQSFLLFFLIITFGNILIRIFYELILIRIMIWKNTTEINKKLK